MPYPTQRNAPAGDRGARDNDRLAGAINRSNTPIAAGSQSPSEKLAIEVTDWRPFERNTLLGFATIFLPQLRLHIGDVTVHQHENGKRWVGLPAKPRLDRDGIPLRGENGKVEYSKILWFDGRAVADAFSAAVLAALDRHLGGETVS
jgi:hypothetical protein